MNKKMTHTGILLGADNRTAPGTRSVVLLRETKHLWISKSNTRYKKTNGFPSGSDWPVFVLNLDSVKLLEEIE